MHDPVLILFLMFLNRAWYTSQINKYINKWIRKKHEIIGILFKEERKEGKTNWQEERRKTNWNEIVFSNGKDANKCPDLSTLHCLLNPQESLVASLVAHSLLKALQKRTYDNDIKQRLHENALYVHGCWLLFVLYFRSVVNNKQQVPNWLIVCLYSSKLCMRILAPNLRLDAFLHKVSYWPILWWK